MGESLRVMKPKFCYRVSPQANMGYDEDGKSVACYLHIEFKGGDMLNKTVYETYHNSLISEFANQLNIKAEHLECISQEEYELHA